MGPLQFSSGVSSSTSIRSRRPACFNGAAAVQQRSALEVGALANQREQASMGPLQFSSGVE